MECHPKGKRDEGAGPDLPGRCFTADSVLNRPSEEQMDFFYVSELRLYVLHALGLINWVWY